MKEYELTQSEILNPAPLLEYYQEKDPGKKIKMVQECLDGLNKMVMKLQVISKYKSQELEAKT